MHEKLISQLVKKQKKYLSYETGKRITWCSGCGNYGIQNALKRALTLEDMGSRHFLYCFDIGCNGNGSDKIRAYTIHGLHGRALSLAAGAAIANRNLKVIAGAGDGATFSEGVGHLVHAVRNNYPLMFIHHNNQNYGLTTGQASCTTPKGAVMNGIPDGVTSDPLNTLEFVLSLTPSFVARTCSGDRYHMTETFRRALQWKGFAYVEVLQHCPTYNHATPESWYLDRVKYIEDKKDYDCEDIWQARKIVADTEKDIYIGLLYCNPKKQNFFDGAVSRKGKKSVLTDEVRHYEIGRFLDKLE